MSDHPTDGRAPAAGRSVLLGLVGAGIARSLTPAMQEREGREQRAGR